MRHYQHKLVKSKESRYLSVRQVSQDNRGKVSTGIDGISKLTPEQRLILAQKIDFEGKRTGTITFVHGHCHDQMHSKSKSKTI